ncbi:hypothetical protein [Polaribacter sp.]|uniref:hypothetical protein n=1 Tax=Polaribacter sp. TaxID=1920175 RepID=UPI003F6A9A58
MKNSLNYKIEHGFLEINTATVKIKYRKGKYALDVLKFFGSVSLISLFVDKLKDYKNIIGVYENTKFWIFAIASVYLVYMFFEFIFRKKWINTLEINDIIKIEIEDDERDKEIDEDSKIDITFYTNNGRRKKIDFKKENQKIDFFLEAVKKRNSRIQIEYL